MLTLYPSALLHLMCRARTQHDVHLLCGHVCLRHGEKVSNVCIVGNVHYSHMYITNYLTI